MSDSAPNAAAYAKSALRQQAILFSLLPGDTIGESACRVSSDEIEGLNRSELIP
jgi:hypothetical protein